MRARLNKKMREAAKTTIVPMTDFTVDIVEQYNAMVAMSTALPNLQQITLGFLREENNYEDGEDPNEHWAAFTAHGITHDIEIMANFRKLRSLTMWRAPLNGRYPVLFNFPLLQKLSVSFCPNLKWDLEMLEGLPLLKELDCDDNPRLSGNLNSLRVLKDTLEKVIFGDCPNVEGNIMDLADFPRLAWLDLRGTNVTGDIRDIRVHDFTALSQPSTYRLWWYVL